MTKDAQHRVKEGLYAQIMALVEELKNICLLIIKQITSDMKKLIIGAFVLCSFFACKKDNSNNNPQSSWISGKWKREDLIDTIFSGTTVAGVNNFNVALNPAELNFNTSNSGTSTISTYGTFTYSLSADVLTYGNGAIWRIVQISSNRFKLIMHEHNTGGDIGWNDSYLKE